MRYVLLVILLVIAGCSSRPQCAHVLPTNPLPSLGDTVTFEPTQMAQRHTIHYSERSATYIALLARTANTPAPFPVFVEPTYQDRITCPPGGQLCTLVVTREWQFGQDWHRTKRFLVLHNKATNKPFQHHFTALAPTIAVLARAAPIASLGWCLQDF